MNTLSQLLFRLGIIRTVLIAVMLTLSLFLGHVLGTELPLLPLSLTILAGMSLNAWTLWRLQQPPPCSEREFCLQLLFDILWLSCYLYLAGGVSNPLISSFLIPVALAAIALPWQQSAWVLLTSTLAYSLLMFYFLPLIPHGDHSTQAVELHLWGMWANYLLSAGLICIFVGQSARSLRRAQAERAAGRETQLRNEQLVGIAIQAAGTAHELGTPLNSAQLICDELSTDPTLGPAAKEDIRCLQKQLQRCRDSLQQLSARCEPDNQREQLPEAITQLLQRLEEHWQLLRPDVALIVENHAQGQVTVDLSLEQALINLLGNAADASPEGLQLIATCANKQLKLELIDQGPGIDPDVAAQLGSPFVSGKASGLGLGWYLSQATLERFGGQVSLHDRTAGGTLTLITLPMAQT